MKKTKKNDQNEKLEKLSDNKGNKLASDVDAIDSGIKRRGDLSGKDIRKVCFYL